MKNELPFISILLPVRNEAHCLINCLNSLVNLRWPKNKMEVLIGDDRSEDNSAKIATHFSSNHVHFHALSIQEQWGNAQGKANVLAQLARKAKGDFLFFTDADMEVPSNWVKGLLEAFDEKVGLVNGFTIVNAKRSNLLGKLDASDWLFNLSLIRWVSRWDKTLTVTGNNMAVRTQAYLETGGYENLPFCITEDFQLMQELNNKKWRSVYSQNSQTEACTLPAENISQLFRQRLRWMQGAVKIAQPYRLTLWLNSFWLPILMVVVLWFPSLALFLFCLKYFLELTWLAFQIEKNNTKELYSVWWAYPIFQMLVLLTLAATYPFNKTVQWKGRHYDLYKYSVDG